MDKTAVVTGAGRGVGAAVAIALARDGFHVVLVSRTEHDYEKSPTQFRALAKLPK